jgi:hypothetical protein
VNTVKTAVAAVLVVIAIGLVLMLPWAWTWAINVFGTYLWPGHPVPYTLETWLGGAVISLFLVPRVTTKTA